MFSLKHLFNKNKLIILGLLIAFIAQSCNVHIEKRRYRKGYHVEVSKRNAGNNTNVGREDNRSVIQLSNNNIIIHKDSEVKIDSLKRIPLVSNQSTITTKKRSTEKQKLISKIPLNKKGEECDVIHLQDGTEIEALVIDISETEISYKKCNFTDGPTYKLSISRVKSIDLKNGDVYTPDPNKVSKDGSDGEVNTTMIVGIILAGIALISVIVAMVLIFSLGGYINLLAAIPLAIAGITSLIGFIITAKFLKKGAHGLGKAGFVANLILQILAILFTVLMWFV